MKQGWKEYFVFTHRERWAIMVLILGMASVWGLHRLFPPQVKPLEIVWNTRLTSSAGAGLKGIPEDVKTWRREDVKKSPKFYFDPNTASQKEWVSLGLTEKQARIILNYISKGGKFRKPEDLLKIYGLRKNQAEELVPFVRITGTATDIKPSEKKLQVREKIEINTATIEDLDKLPGIGLKLGDRILKFRDKLGGFYSVYQVAETFGLQDSVFKKIQPLLSCNGKVIQININSVDKASLGLHPYFRGVTASAIINYRDQHGPFKSVEELKAVSVLTPEQFQKISPYLTVE